MLGPDIDNAEIPVITTRMNLQGMHDEMTHHFATLDLLFSSNTTLVADHRAHLDAHMECTVDIVAAEQRAGPASRGV